MSTTTTPKPSSPLLSRLPKNKRRLFFILAAVVALLFAANSIGRAYHRYTLLHKDMMQAQILFSQYREHIDNRLNYNEGVRLAQLEQAWALSEAKMSRQQETIEKLEQALAQKSNHHSDLNLLQELKTQKEMYLQTQQKLQSYEQHLLALAQELKASREQSQLIKREQAKIREELIKKLGQNTPQTQISEEALEKALESRLSQFVYADYELEQKLKDLQKTVESAAKVGELKALEVYYDDKIDSLSDMIKSSGKKALPQGQAQVRKESSEVSQLKQELIKLHMEKEEMKAAVNNLWNQQRKSEEKLNKLVEIQANQNKKPSIEEQPQINRPTKVNNTPKTPQKEVNQKAQMKEQQQLIDDFFKQFGIKSNVEVERPSQQNHFNQRRAHPGLNNLNHHPQARMGRFNRDPFHQFSGFPRFNNFDPRINPIGMMDDVMFW